MTRHTDYPRDIIAAYSGGAITKNQFKNRFAAWQKAHGINYDCKGTADRYGVYVTYRGTKARIRDGVLCFYTANMTADFEHRYESQQAKSITEFRRKVDFAKRGAAWN